MSRIKVTNKVPIPYERTVGGLKKLVERLELEGIPEVATVDWRDWNVAEFLWSAENGVSRTSPEG